jgi:plastocyanin
MRAALLAVVASAMLALPGVARAELVFVSMAQSSFEPAHLEVLVGDNVTWRNSSLREHNVRSDAAGFESGRLDSGAVFAHGFDAPGIYPYVCTIHASMTGEVGVYPLLLDGPRRPVAAGAPLELHVRPAAGVSAVTIEQDSGAGFHPVATAVPRAGDHGGHDEAAQEGYTLHATLTATTTATYRAVAGDQVSPSLRVEVSAARLALSASARRGGALLRVTGVPAKPGARVALQLRLRERFGWWTVDRARLDRRSRARFVLRRRRPVRARAIVLAANGVSALATSPPVTVRPRPPRAAR